MPTLVFLGDIHDENNSISQSLLDVNIDLQHNTYAVLVEEIMIAGDELIGLNDYENSVAVICEQKDLGAEDRQTMLNLMNGSDNNVYAFDVDGQAEELQRHQGQRANIQHLLGLPGIANLDFVIVIDGDGHLLPNQDVHGWVEHQHVPPNYNNVGDIVVGHPQM